MVPLTRSIRFRSNGLPPHPAAAGLPSPGPAAPDGKIAARYAAPRRSAGLQVGARRDSSGEQRKTGFRSAEETNQSQPRFTLVDLDDSLTGSLHQ
jgi:hypothetical protein